MERETKGHVRTEDTQEVCVCRVEDRNKQVIFYISALKRLFRAELQPGEKEDLK